MFFQKLTNSYSLVWLPLLLILLNKVSVNGVEQKAINFLSFFIPYINLYQFNFFQIWAIS